MKGHSIIIRELARRDLWKHLLYISKDSLDAAVRLLEAFDAACASLVENPNIGSPRLMGRKQPRLVRSWAINGFTNYIIYFRSTRHGIEVLRVTHGAQNVNSKFGRP